MGHGDWNDGMNRVGAGGKGESVWLAWFSIATFRRFAGLAESRGDSARAADLRRTRRASWPPPVEAQRLGRRMVSPRVFRRRHAAGLGPERRLPDRLARAVVGRALRRGRPRARPPGHGSRRRAAGRPPGRLILLFTPPFDDEPLDPGYIKGYLPGHPRERRPVHARGHLGRAGVRRAPDRAGWPPSCSTILNPIRHAEDPEGVERYKVEPYVVAGDVYSRPPHVGRGGWTWYTGSAAWLYRTILESILGLHRHGDRLTIDPCIPPDWPGFEITYRFRSTTYRIAVENPRGLESGKAAVWLDGQAQAEPVIPLADDGRVHEVRVEIT